MLQVHILVGPSAAGKTSYANRRGMATVGANEYFTTADGEYRFDPRDLPVAHAQCMQRFITACQIADDNGRRSFSNESEVQHLAVDNTNCLEIDAVAYVRIAQAYDIDVRIDVMVADLDICSANNIHNVPMHTLKRQVMNRNLLLYKYLLERPRGERVMDDDRVLRKEMIDGLLAGVVARKQDCEDPIGYMFDCPAYLIAGIHEKLEQSA